MAIKVIGGSFQEWSISNIWFHCEHSRQTKRLPSFISWFYILKKCWFLHNWRLPLTFFEVFGGFGWWHALCVLMRLCIWGCVIVCFLLIATLPFLFGFFSRRPQIWQICAKLIFPPPPPPVSTLKENNISLRDKEFARDDEKEPSRRE